MQVSLFAITPTVILQILSSPDSNKSGTSITLTFSFSASCTILGTTYFLVNSSNLSLLILLLNTILDSIFLSISKSSFNIPFPKISIILL